ncbi:MAG: DUF6046 domain-containing protein [Bacteroidales bacterium]
MELDKQYTENTSRKLFTIEKISPKIYIPLVKLNLDRTIKKQLRQVTQRTVVSLAGRSKQYAVNLLEDTVNDIYGGLVGRKKGKYLTLIDNGLPVLEEAPFLNMFGYEVRDYLILEGKTQSNSYSVKNIPTANVSSDLIDQRFVDFHAVMKVSEKKNILMTQVQGRDRTRKEYISGGDLIINVSGKIVSKHPDIYPSAEVEKLYALLNSKEIVSCNSPFLTMFGISGMVILDYDIPQNSEFKNVQHYSFTAVYEPGVPILLAESKKSKDKLEAELKRKTGWMSFTDKIKSDASKFVFGTLDRIKNEHIEIQI